MTQDAHAALRHELHAPLVVEVQHGGAERPHEDLDLAVTHVSRPSRDHVGHEPLARRHLDGVGALEAGVHEDADALALAAAPEAKDVLSGREGLELAVHQDREHLAQRDGVAVYRGAVGVAALPREARAVVGVAEALDAALVPVVDAGDARERHLEQRHHPQARLREPDLVVGEAVGRTLLLGERVGVGRAAEHREQALAVVAAQEVEGGVEVVARVVLSQLLEARGQLGGADVAAYEGEKPRAHGVVHRGVELPALEVLAQLAVGELVGGVLPDLADQHPVGLLREKRLLDLRDELVRELVGHVEAPAAGAGAQPVADDALTAADELVELLAVRAHAREVLVSPPAGVGPVVVEGEPVAVAGALSLPGARLAVGAEAVEVARVGAHVVEDAVQDDRDAVLLGVDAQGAEALLVAKHRVYAQVVGRVIAMVARRLEDGVEIDCGHAQVLEVAELLADALEGAPVEVPALDAALLGPRVGGRGVPVLEHRAARAALAADCQRGRGALLPVRPARKAVGEDLVDDALAVPPRLPGARRVDRDLERRRVAVGEGALARGPPLARAVAPHRAVGGLDVKAVPHHTGLGRLVACREAQVVTRAGASHLDELLAVGVRPDAQRAEDDVVAPHVDTQRNGAAQLDGTEWGSVLGL